MEGAVRTGGNADSAPGPRPAGLPTALFHLRPRSRASPAAPAPLSRRPGLPTLSLLDPASRRHLGQEETDQQLGKKRQARSSREPTEPTPRPHRVPCASGRAPGPLRLPSPPPPASHSARAVPSGRQEGRVTLLVESGRAASPDSPPRSGGHGEAQSHRAEGTSGNSSRLRNADFRSRPALANQTPALTSLPPGRRRKRRAEEGPGADPEGAGPAGGSKRSGTSWGPR